MSVIYDESGDIIENPDLTLGHLEYRQKTVYHQWIVDVEEEGHWETVSEDPDTGGSLVEWVIDVPEEGHWQTTDEEGSIITDFDGVIADDWSHEQITSDIWYYYVYVLYTEEELDAQKRREAEYAISVARQVQVDDVIYYMAMKAGLTDAMVMDVNLMFPEWKTGSAYSAGDVCNYNGDPYRALVNNVGATGSTPDVPNANWEPVNPPVDNIASWRLPSSVDAAYSVDDEVMYDGARWISTINYNVWTPGVKGWNEVS